MARGGWAVSFVLAAALGACSQSPVPAAARPMLVARYYWPGAYWIDIAAERGWFREAGLDVRLVDTNGDYLASMRDTVAGRLDTAQFPPYDLVSYVARGAELVGVLATDLSLGADGVVGRPPAKSMRDLAGRRVAVGRGTYMEYVLAVALETVGARIEDVVLLDATGEKAPGLFAAGEVDAFASWEPYLTEAEAKGGVRLFDTARLPGLSGGIQTFRRAFVEERRPDVQAFVRVWDRAMRFLKDDPESAHAIVAKIYGRTPREVADFARIDLPLGRSENNTAFSYAAGLESLHGSLLRAQGFLAHKRRAAGGLFDTTRLLDGRFVRDLREKP